MSDRIEAAEGVKVVAEKFETDGPWRRRREDVENTAAEGEFALVVYLSLGFVTLGLEPFGEFHRVGLISAFNATGALGKGGGWIGLLEKRDNTGDNDGCPIVVEATRFIMGSATRSFRPDAQNGGRDAHAAQSRVGEFHQCFKAVADDVDVREFGFVGQDFPRGEEERFGQPGFDVLLQTFLGLEAFGDDDDRALRKFFANESGDECVSGWWHT